MSNKFSGSYPMPDENDYRFMAAAIRLSNKHCGLTQMNPSVGAILVQNSLRGPVVVGRGITAVGGRPHAEIEALKEAGDLARGATAYVTLEPCAHEGKTPSCALALVKAGIKRLVGGSQDPDGRVMGRGYEILQKAGVEVIKNVLADQAREVLQKYFILSIKKRPKVIVKLALSSDNKIGIAGQERVKITGALAQAQVHLMRASVNGILVGAGTVLADDPQLTTRLPGLEVRNPVRIILDPNLRLPIDSFLARTAHSFPVWIATTVANSLKKQQLAKLGIVFLSLHKESINLKLLMNDLAEKGISSLLVEGGAKTVNHFMQADIVDRIILFRADKKIGNKGIPSPINESNIPECFKFIEKRHFGEDYMSEWVKKI